MARTTHLFVGREATLGEIRGAVYAAVGAAFEVNSKSESVLAFNDASVYVVKGHHFDDEDMQWPDRT